VRCAATRKYIEQMIWLFPAQAHSARAGCEEGLKSTLYV
jgi:hypothetical protein